MKNKEDTGNKLTQASEQAPDPLFEELEQSYYLIKTVMKSLAPEDRKELVELLRILAEGSGSQEKPPVLRKKALQIVTAICRYDQPKLAQIEPERRVVERRQADRRQGNRRLQAHHYGSPWTAEQIRTLRILANQKIPLRRIAARLGRTSTAVESKAKELDIRLLPV